MSGVPRKIGWEGQSREAGWWGPPRKWEWARGLGVTDTQVLQGTGSGNFQTRGLDDVLSPSVPLPPSPDNRSSFGPENLSLLPWSLGDFEQMVTSLTLHDPNIFGPQ